MHDPTETARRQMLATNQPDRDLEEARAAGMQVWTTEEMSRDFKVDAFLAPFVFVIRRSDGVEGTLEFTHRPRFYFNFQPDKREGTCT